jgi:hypothetical protein
MKEFKLDPGVILYAFVIGCLISALFLWATGSFAAEPKYQGQSSRHNELNDVIGEE